MEIGIDEDVIEEQNDGEFDSLLEEGSEDGLIATMLQDRGIEDPSKIKFEGDDGTLLEVDWNDLSNEEKLNILDTSTYTDEDDLDDDEVKLINTIRSSGLTPQEFMSRVLQRVARQQQVLAQPTYSVDLYNDDELYVADFMSRANDVTEEEAQEALAKAKSNPTLFAKQMGAIRNEYKTIERENMQLALIEQLNQAQLRFNQFAQNVADEIRDLTELLGYDLNLEEDDMQDLYDFITGTDAAGYNHFAKALSDPKTLVLTAWFALNGKLMINDITNYFLKEITQVRQLSYRKGYADAQASKSSVVYKPTQSRQSIGSDLDDF